MLLFMDIMIIPSILSMLFHLCISLIHPILTNMVSLSMDSLHSYPLPILLYFMIIVTILHNCWINIIIWVSIVVRYCSISVLVFIIIFILINPFKSIVNPFLVGTSWPFPLLSVSIFYLLFSCLWGWQSLVFHRILPSRISYVIENVVFRSSFSCIWDMYNDTFFYILYISIFSPSPAYHSASCSFADWLVLYECRIRDYPMSAIIVWMV